MDSISSDFSTAKYPAYEAQLPDISKLLEDPFEALGLKQFSEIVNAFCLDFHLVCQEQGIFLTKILNGRGSFGRVYQVPSFKTVEMYKYVGKVFNLEHQYNLPKVLNEFQIQYELNKLHPDKYLYFKPPILLQQAYPNHLYNILATLESGKCNLYQYLQQEQDIDDSEYFGIFYQILDSIIAMHNHHYAHRDIKPQNILYVYEKGWLLADFGCAQKYEKIEDEYEIAGTKAFNYEEIRNQINKQKQLVQINLLKNDLYAFCLTMLMVKYPKHTVTECQQMIENKQSEVSELNQIFNLLDEKDLLLKIEQLLPFQYEKVNPKFDDIKLRSTVVCDPEVKPDETDDWDYLTGRGIERLKQKIYIELYIRGATKKIKNFQLILTDPLSQVEATLIPLYLIKVEQYTKCKEVLPKCFKMGLIRMKILELIVNIKLNNYVEAFNVSNEIEQNINQLSFIDKAIFYLMKNYLIFEQKGDLWIDISYIYQYIADFFKGQTHIFLNEIILKYYYCFVVKHGINVPQILQNIIQIFEPIERDEIQNQFRYLKSKCYHILNQNDEAKQSIIIFLQGQNPQKLIAKELLNQLLQECTEPVVIQRILFQIADCEFMLNNYQQSCEFFAELIYFCESKFIKIQFEYYIHYVKSLLHIKKYDKALNILQLTSFLDCTNFQKLTLIWTEATTYYFQGQIEQSKSKILSLFEVLQQYELTTECRMLAIGDITKYLELLVRTQQFQFAKQLFETTQNQYIKTEDYEDIKYEAILRNLYTVSINIYLCLKDYLQVRFSYKFFCKIVKLSNIQLYQFNKIVILKISGKAYEQAEGNKLENNQKAAYYYQKYIDFLKNYPIDSRIVNAYIEFIHFYQQINHPGVYYLVQNYVVFMIDNFGFEDPKTKEAISMLQIYT